MGANSIPRVCVGMPVYNGERWIRESIESILSQTYPAFDLRISDNASTDGTRAICEEYVARDPRVRYFRNDRNVGVFRNYDLAFKRCDADYFKFPAETGDEYFFGLDANPNRNATGPDLVLEVLDETNVLLTCDSSAAELTASFTVTTRR